MKTMNSQKSNSHKKQSTKLATHDHVLRLEKNMATKDDLKKLRKEMATKDDLKKLRKEMATKDDLKALEKRMDDKMDIAFAKFVPMLEEHRRITEENLTEKLGNMIDKKINVQTSELIAKIDRLQDEHKVAGYQISRNGDNISNLQSRVSKLEKVC